MKVRQFVRISAVIDLLRIEYFLHRAGHPYDIGHECVPFFVAEHVQVVYVVFVGNQATPAIRLFLEQEQSGYRERSDFDHQLV